MGPSSKKKKIRGWPNSKLLHNILNKPQNLFTTCENYGPTIYASFTIIQMFFNLMTNSAILLKCFSQLFSTVHHHIHHRAAIYEHFYPDPWAIGSQYVVRHKAPRPILQPGSAVQAAYRRTFLAVPTLLL